MLKLKTQTTKISTNELSSVRQKPPVETDKQLHKLIGECDNLILQQRLILQIKQRREQIEDRRDERRSNQIQHFAEKWINILFCLKKSKAEKKSQVKMLRKVKELMMQCNKHYKLGLKGWLLLKKQRGHYNGHVLF